MRDTMRMLAWHAANVIQPWTKKRVHPSALLGERRALGEMFLTVEDVKDHFRQKAERAARSKAGAQ